jgi:hypothetical protein
MASLDYVFLQFNCLLQVDGVFVSMEYVGPHRNQYSDPLWAKLNQVNATAVFSYFDTVPPAAALCVLKTRFLFAAAEAGNHRQRRDGGGAAPPSRPPPSPCVCGRTCVVVGCGVRSAFVLICRPSRHASPARAASPHASACSGACVARHAGEQ